MSPTPSPRERRAAYSQETVELLVEQVRAGGPEAMEELYELLIAGLKLFFRRQLPPDTVEDRAHNVFLITLNAIRGGQLRDPARLAGFVRTVAQRQAADAIRGLERGRQGQFEAVEELLADRRANPEEALWERQRIVRMRKALATLSPRDREILTRFYLEDQSAEAICAEMGLTETQFRLLKSRAKARLCGAGDVRRAQPRAAAQSRAAG